MMPGVRTLADPCAIFLVVALACFGGVIWISASLQVELLESGTLWRQLGSLFWDLLPQGILMLVVLFVPLAVWKDLSRFWLLGSIYFLAYLPTLFAFLRTAPDHDPGWLSSVSSTAQPSACIMPMLAIFLAGHLTRHREKLYDHWSRVFVCIMWLLPVLVALLLAASFINAITVVLAAFALLFLAGANLIPLLIAFALTSSFLFVTAIVLRAPDIGSALLNPWGYIIEGAARADYVLPAIARGGWSGQGLGEGIIKFFHADNNSYLVVIEELGLMGAIATILVFVVLGYRGFRIVNRCLDRRFYYLGLIAASGIVFLMLQAFFGLGFNTGLLPGGYAPVPFLGYGWDYLSACIILAVLFLRVDYELGARRVRL